MIDNIVLVPKESAIQGDWIIFTLKSVGANIKRKVGSKNERTVWATLEPPSDKEIQVAQQRHPGAGTQPENTLTLVEVHDIVHEIIKSLEWALDDAEQKGDW